jgi:hypothetical protein
MKYRPLFTMSLTHTYYTDRRCPDFMVEPTPETRRRLNNYRCIAKPFANGFQVLVATDDTGAPLIQQEKGATFGFQLVLRNLDFPLFTNYSKDGEPTTRLYTNLRVPKTGPAPLTAVFNPDSTAEVKIIYDDSAPTSAPGSVNFQLEFAAKQVWWKYYLVSDPGSDAFLIKDQEKAAPLVFGSPIELSAPAVKSDRVATMLAEQYPGKRLLSFLSKKAVACRQQPHQSLRLFAGANLALGGLPNPSVRNYAFDGAPGGAQGKVYLFQVLKYVTDLGASSGG